MFCKILHILQLFASCFHLRLKPQDTLHNIIQILNVTCSEVLQLAVIVRSINQYKIIVQYISYTYISRKPMIQLSYKRNIVELITYRRIRNTLTVKLVMLVIYLLCLNETHNKVRIHNHLLDAFPRLLFKNVNMKIIRLTCCFILV